MTLSARARLDLETRNTHGLHVFPDELLLEIISHFNIPPPPPSSSVTAVVRNTSVPSPFERREALISLSETCCSLRQFLRPYIWDCIEVRNGMKVGKRGRQNILDQESREKKKEFSGEILRQLQVTTVMDLTLGQYVK